MGDYIMKRLRGNKIFAVTVCISMLVSSVGCNNRRKVEYIVGDVATSSDADETIVSNDMSGVSVAERLGVPERWDEELEGGDNMKGIDINAEIKVPDVTRVNVYKTQSILLTDEYKEEFINKLTEGEVYKNDDDSKPKSYWQAKIDENEFKLEHIDDEYIPYEYEGDKDTDVDVISIVNIGPSDENLQAEIEGYKEKYNNAPDSYIPAEDYSGNSYVIKYNGINYDVDFVADGEGYITSISLFPTDTREILNEDVNMNVPSLTGAERGQDMEYDTGKLRYTSEDNLYKRTSEQITEEAGKFLEDMGISGFELARTYDVLFWGNVEDKYVHIADGCCAVMLKNNAGMFFAGEDYESKQIVIEGFDGEETMDIGRNKLETIDLYINDSGLIGMKYCFPLEWSLETENVQLLDFSVIKETFAEEAKNVDDEHPVFTNVDFVYCICADEYGAHEFMVVPAWKMYVTTGGNIYVHQIMINAIDGSVIPSVSGYLPTAY